MTLLKTVKLSSRRQITIPKSFKILSSGENAILKIEESCIKIIPQKFSKETYLNEESLKENWLSEEDEKNYKHLKNLI